LPVLQVDSKLPVRFKIPKINIDAAIKYVGITLQGAMDVPKGPSDVAWFNLGPRPGESGSAVIVGHFGWKNNIPAVFDNLNKLQNGDKIYIEDGNGITTTFLVRKIQIYGENESASDVFNSSDGKAHLNLITCQGIWNKIQKSYSNRLVVFTDKETEIIMKK
jgi:LPXTG-site transpeptidase (sortase) family protein